MTDSAVTDRQTLNFRSSPICLLSLFAALSCRRVEAELDPDPGQLRPSHGTVVEAKLEPPPVMMVPDFADIAAMTNPSVVTVISTVARAPGTRGKVVRGLGSGMIVSPFGQILTNEHVISTATRVDVELATGERFPARVVVAESLLDLALLELEGSHADLHPVTLADRSARPGEWVMAVGQPFGLGQTVTVGVVSGLGRDHDDLGSPEGLRADGVWHFIQTDASINIGNSGGPLVDARGRVIGVTTAVRNDGQGLAFATPAAMVRRFLEEVRSYGRLRPTRLGIKAENTFGSGRDPGRSTIQVTHVDDDGPGAEAGLLVGDFILALGGVDVSRVSEVAYLTQLHGVGARITLNIERSDGQRSLVVIPRETTSAPNGREVP